LRRKIARMANDIRERVKAYNLTDELGNRAGDNWDPLFAIASAAGENWLQLVKKDAEEHVSGAPDIKSFNKYLLESLRRIIVEKRREESKSKNLFNSEKELFLPTHHLLDELNADNEAPWKEKTKRAFGPPIAQGSLSIRRKARASTSG
jgi:Protein of unknown function (DUF3631)